MKAIVLFLLIISLPLLCLSQQENKNQSSGPADQNHWQRLVSAEGHFNVLMPGDYKEATATAKLAGANVVKHDFVNATKNRRFSVSYLDLSGQIAKEKELKSMLQDSCRLFNVGHHNVVGAAFIIFKDNPGIQCTLDNGGGIEVMQVFIVAERMYLLNAYTNHEHTPTADCMTFLHSFDLGINVAVKPPTGGVGSSPDHGKSDSGKITGQYSEGPPPDEKSNSESTPPNEKNRAGEATLALGDVGSIEVNGKNEFSSKLQLLSNPRPDYTTFARDHKIVGMVVIEANFTSEGMVKDVKVIRPLGYGLDEMAIQAVYRIKFRPAERDGKKVSIRQNIRVSFTLL